MSNSNNNSSHTPSTITKLKEPEDYPSWSVVVEPWLTGEGLWDYISGEEPEPFPSQLNLETGIITLPLKMNDSDKQKQKSWKQQDAKAQGKILALLDNSLLLQFRSHSTANS